MKKQKAEKHLAYCRQDLEYLRNNYIETMRNPNWRRLDSDRWIGGNPFKERIANIRKDMEETKTRIARFERIVR